MTIRNLIWPDDREALLDYFHEVNDEDDFALLSVTYGDAPTFDPADCFVIEGEQGEIVAHGMLIPHQIQIGESLLPSAEISLLSVRASYEGLGYEGQLLEVLHGRMNEREDVLGLTFGDPLLFDAWQYEYAVGLYLTSYESDIALDLALRAGVWDPLHSYERRMAERLGARRREVNVRRFYLNDLPAVQALYADESLQGNYLLARDEATWLWQIDVLGRTGRSDPDDFLVAEVEGQLVAYARLVSQAQVNVFRDVLAARFSVIEAGGTDPDGLDALLSAAARTAQTLNTDRIGLFVPPDSAFMQQALARGASLRQFTGAGLVRMHHLPLALHLLTPALEARRLQSRFAQRAYHLIITTEQDQAAIYLGEGDAEIVELEAPSTAITRLITGWFGVDHLSMGYHERYADLLRVLFPQRDPRIALADVI